MVSLKNVFTIVVCTAFPAGATMSFAQTNGSDRFVDAMSQSQVDGAFKKMVSVSTDAEQKKAIRDFVANSDIATKRSFLAGKTKIIYSDDPLPKKPLPKKNPFIRDISIYAETLPLTLGGKSCKPKPEPKPKRIICRVTLVCTVTPGECVQRNESCPEPPAPVDPAVCP